MSPSFRSTLGAISIAFVLALAGCGGSGSYTPPPIVLSVSLSNATIDLQQGGTTYAPVTIDAPTETASFSILGLPPGVSQSYKESESNPSGLLTLTANASAPIGTYMPKITVGSSGQTASTIFTLVITAPTKGSTP
jgi:hypothetical protein